MFDNFINLLNAIVSFMSRVSPARHPRSGKTFQNFSALTKSAQREISRALSKPNQSAAMCQFSNGLTRVLAATHLTKSMANLVFYFDNIENKEQRRLAAKKASHDLDAN